MTNYEYIISRVNKLPERDLMFVLLYDQSSDYNLLGKQIESAFKAWRNKLCPESVFVKEFKLEFFNDEWFKPKRVGRTKNISFQVWLSKPYNPEEWRDTY